jgi:RHS repeat-associated protein
VTTGLPPFGSFSGGPDIVNNASLNDHIEIPVVAKAGRGLPFYYILTYDSSVWSPINASGTNTWTPVGGWGWGTISQPEVGFATYSWSQGVCTDLLGNVYYYDIYSKWVYSDSLDAPHPIAPGVKVSDQSVVAPNCHAPGPAYQAQATVTDGSGYTLYVTAAPAYARSGTAYQAVVGSQSVFAKDANGNQISYNGSSFTDTLGVTALTISGSPPNRTTFTYTNPRGTGSSFTMNYTQKTVQTNFGCSAVTEYGATSQYLVSGITLPDGTSYNFTYEVTPNDTHNPHYVTGRIASVQLPTGGTISYSYSGGSNGITCADGSAAGLSRTTPDGAWSYTRSAGPPASTAVQDPQDNQTVIDFQGIYETQRQVNQGASTLLETVNTCYNGASIPCTSTAVSLPIANRTVQVTLPSVSPSQTYTTYNTYGLTTETDQYNYGSSLVRKTITSYTGCGVTNANVVNRPCSVTTENASGGTVASTTYSYDANGNLLTESHSTGGTPATVSRSFTHGSYGVLTSQTDFNANTTSYSSFACGSNTAFPQTASLPLSLSTSISWNCYVALPNSTTDVNGNPTTYSYDSMVRPTAVSYPGGGSVDTTYTNPTQTDLETAITTSTSRHDQLDLDGLDRVITSALVNDPDGETYVATSYDALGRVSSISNPYRGSSSLGGDTYAYDALNRVTGVTHADGSSSQIAYGSGTSQGCPPSTYSYGYSTLYTDESGNPRQTFTDALGRVIEADEPTSGSKSLSVSTCYKYDVLNDLTEVDQGSSETRKYGYDMLSRLTQVTTPEGKNNTEYFYYTASGNTLCAGDPSAVCRRTDERGITTTYTYDTLNRLGAAPSTAAISYSNGDPSVYYSYDQTSYNGLTIANGKGQRTGMSDGSGQTAWSYDKMGRIVAEERTIGSVTKTVSYGYNLDGSLASVAYPSGRTVSYAVGAAGRPVSAVDTGDSINYVASATYAPQGALQTADYGANITFSAGYNNRLLPTNLQGSTVSPSTTFFQLQPSYNANGAVSGVANALISGRTQSFTYDYLNRIITGQSTATSGTYCWGQSIPTNGTGYDRYGNLLMINSSQCSAPTLNLSVNGYNQITNSGFSYDASGNMLTDGSGNSYTWNAERLLKSAASVNYTYDGDGKRVEKSSGTYYWLSPDGIPLAETDSSGNTQNEYIYFNGGRTARRDSAGNVYYYFSDQIGTARMLTNASGTVCYDADYTPFGYEMAYTTSCAQNYKFTGMQRDSETGNDHTWLRNYEQNLGRWMSPDPLGGDVINPQSLNRYAYVLNNPNTLIDPLGLQPWPCDPQVDPDCCDPRAQILCCEPGDPLCPWGGGGGGSGGGGGGSTGSSAGNSPSSNFKLGTSCLSNAVKAAIEADLLGLFNSTFGTKLIYDPNNPNGISYTVVNGTMTLTVDQPGGTPVSQIPGNPGTPYDHPDFRYDIRPKNAVPSGPGDYGHVLWNLFTPAPNTVATAQVHMDIGTFSKSNPRGTARHGIRAVFEFLQGDPGCAQKFADFGTF